ncbi:PARA-aminobenzoate synthase component I and II [Corynebacterium renale]|nr:PARA-aminobenzoate synthase component I and II [Corynebacterium renale]STC95586.1 PARA-aminobenzoate synthase component I and II [Corynebacterium renale]
MGWAYCPATLYPVILLVDNRDSYTFNLAHLIAAQSGEEPLVVSADDVFTHRIPERIRAGEFRHVVVSPGPGHPETDADFAASRAVIEASQGIPLLGVCLGHQGLALLAGAEVTKAEPHHGVLSTVTHSGEGIFEGVPQGVEVVRYHSLHVAEPLPDCLEVHARSEDGTIQALKVAGQPHWGVQFHPESILTLHGDTLMANFLHLTPAPQFQVLHSQHPLTTDPESVFAALRAQHPQHFWLDCATGDSWSIMGTGAGHLTRTISGEQVLEHLAQGLNQSVDRTTVPAEVPFAGGFVGYLQYPRPVPGGCWLMPQAFIAIDHSTDTAHCMVLYKELIDAETYSLMSTLEQALRAAYSEPGPARVVNGQWRMSRDTYLHAIDAAKEYLAAGDSYEVCLTDTWEGRCEGTGFDLYRKLRASNPAPYAAYLHLSPDEPEILCSSPERFLKVRDRVVETKPIKGTAPRDTDPRALQEDPKTRSENLMIVDLLRNDLARVCTPGTVTVPHLMAVETYASVHQLVTTIRGTLRPDATVVDLIGATFPGGSMTGAPKERTLEIIDRLEAGPRGVYSGTIGYLGFDGNADLNIVIRTATKSGDTVHIGAGGAIVWASDPEAEYQEKQLKAEAVLEGLQD